MTECQRVKFLDSNQSPFFYVRNMTESIKMVFRNPVGDTIRWRLYLNERLK